MGKIIGIIFLLAVLAFGGYYVYKNPVPQDLKPEAMMDAKDKTEKDGMMEGKDEAMEKGDEMMKEKSGKMMDAGESMMKESVAPQTVTVKITDSGFVPAEVSIRKGDSVVWMNESARSVWPASASHPTHRGYPGSDIALCGSSEQAGFFDSCKGLGNGQSWTFQFKEIGSWYYHDHLNASQFGQVIVAE